MMLFLLKGYEYYDEQEKGYFVFMDCLENPTSEQQLCSVVAYEVKRGERSTKQTGYGLQNCVA